MDQTLRYRPRTKDTSLRPTIKSFSLTPETVRQLNELRNIHHTKFPRATYPNLSMVLEQVINETMAQFEANEGMLEGNVEDMRQRYATVKPKE